MVVDVVRGKFNMVVDLSRRGRDEWDRRRSLARRIAGFLGMFRFGGRG